MSDDERMPVIPSEVVPHRYTDDVPDPEGSRTSAKPLSREMSIDVQPNDQLTLTWRNINAYAVPDTRKCWHRCCPPDPSSADATPLRKQILFNGLSVPDRSIR